jgi:cyclophilin family peptidyl-prolyl cis-trans isomerase
MRLLRFVLVTGLTTLVGPARVVLGADEATPQVVVETDLGSFTIRLLPDIAPVHSRQFVDAARGKEYDHTTFHRIIPSRVIQGGDPISKNPSRTAEYGRGGMSKVQIESSERRFTRGSVVAVRCPSDSSADGQQFFVLLTDAPELGGGHYTIFGEVASGMEAVDAIGAAGSDDGQPRRRIEMKVRPAP